MGCCVLVDDVTITTMWTLVLNSKQPIRCEMKNCSRNHTMWTGLKGLFTLCNYDFLKQVCIPVRSVQPTSVAGRGGGVSYRVPTHPGKPGKMGRYFPVREITQNTGNLRETQTNAENCWNVSSFQLKEQNIKKNIGKMKTKLLKSHGILSVWKSGNHG